VLRGLWISFEIIGRVLVCLALIGEPGVQLVWI